MLYRYAQPSPYPPSFDGNPWAYGFGLFGDVVATALALALLFSYIFEARRHHQANTALGGMVSQVPVSRWSPLFLYRTANMSLLIFVVMRALPDALWMLAWGEVPEKTIHAMLAIDLLFDGLAIAPLVLSATCWAWGRQVIPQRLIADIDGLKVRGPPTWDLLWTNGRIVLVVLIISVGVTIGKASA